MDNNFLFIPFDYVVTSASIVANGSTITPLLLDQDADFELHEIIASSSVDVASDIRPNNFSWQIADKSNGRNWSDALVPQMVAARIPGGQTMKRPVLMARRSNLAVTFQNLTGNAIVCVLVLMGAKVLKAA